MLSGPVVSDPNCRYLDGFGKVLGGDGGDGTVPACAMLEVLCEILRSSKLS